MSRTILTDSASSQSAVDDITRWAGQPDPGPADGAAITSEAPESPGNGTQEEDQSAPASPPVAGQTGPLDLDLRASVGAGRSPDAAKAGRADEM